MNWATFYLICFLVGFLLSVISLLSGMIHFPGHLHVHLPHPGGHHGGGLHAPGPHGATPAAGHDQQVNQRREDENLADLPDRRRSAKREASISLASTRACWGLF